MGPVPMTSSGLGKLRLVWILVPPPEQEPPRGVRCGGSVHGALGFSGCPGFFCLPLSGLLALARRPSPPPTPASDVAVDGSPDCSFPCPDSVSHIRAGASSSLWIFCAGVKEK